MSTLTPRQKELRKKYTRASTFFGEWAAVLKIDHQSFYLHGSESRKSENWTRDMLAIALDRMIENEKKDVSI